MALLSKVVERDFAKDQKGTIESMNFW